MNLLKLMRRNRQNRKASIKYFSEVKSIRQLCSQLAKLEGKKSESSIGNVRELVKLLAIALQNPKVLRLMKDYGKRTAKKKLR